MDVDRETTPSKEDPYWYQQFRDTKGNVLEDRVGCDNFKCSNEGAYYVTKVCCNGVIIQCRGCFTSLFGWLTKHESVGGVYTCAECGTDHNPTEVFNKVKKIRLTPA